MEVMGGSRQIGGGNNVFSQIHWLGGSIQPNVPEAASNAGRIGELELNQGATCEFGRHSAEEELERAGWELKLRARVEDGLDGQLVQREEQPLALKAKPQAVDTSIVDWAQGEELGRRPMARPKLDGRPHSALDQFQQQKGL